MNQLEMEFLDEYKSVDNICKDMFKAQHGVTEYINQMEKLSLRGSQIVANWNEKYRMLKHLRWLRNQIVHDNMASEITENDYIELMHFHQQLLKQLDPLAALTSHDKVSLVKAVHVDYGSFQVGDEENEELSVGAIIIIIVTAIVIAVILVSTIL